MFFNNVSCHGRIENFSGGGHQIFLLFCCRVTSNKRTFLGGPGACSPENLRTIMAILVFFYTVFRQNLFIFLASMSASPNMMYFVRTVSIMRA